mmetsp:Transcript_5460/g.11598  ORF Transcript_5460/g.11598 Transcript_5460/m.11598 type:complete len:102 (-) Transcript_5460:1493-1798(-)
MMVALTHFQGRPVAAAPGENGPETAAIAAAAMLLLRGMALPKRPLQRTTGVSYDRYRVNPLSFQSWSGFDSPGNWNLHVQPGDHPIKKKDRTLNFSRFVLS